MVLISWDSSFPSLGLASEKTPSLAQRSFTLMVESSLCKRSRVVDQGPHPRALDGLLNPQGNEHLEKKD